MTRIAFVSCNETPWGGSEELWARAAICLADQGHDVFVAKPRITLAAEPIRDLRSRGVPITDLFAIGPVPGRMINFVSFLARPAMFAWLLLRLWAFLTRRKPDLIVLSQGGSWDGFYMERVLSRFDIPYVLICQKASDLYWPPDSSRATIARLVTGAAHVFTVSHHNLRLLQEQISARLDNASVVRNPFLVDYDAPQPWPAETDPVRIACIGRLYPMEKGQDMLLRVLARDRWQARNIHVDFYGEGINRAGLEAMAQFLGLKNVAFHGHVEDIGEIWANHHALVLPSRAEGLPLVLVETMLSGRIAIVSIAGGSGEVLEHGVDGFVMDGYDEDSLDRAMEDAWQAREDWPEIALRAAASIRKAVPASPPADLARRIVEIAAKR